MAIHMERNDSATSLKELGSFLQTQPRCSDSTELPSPRLREVGLPEEDLVRNRLALCSSQSPFIAIPVVDPILFQTTISEAYSTECFASTSTERAKKCVLAFLCFFSLLGLTQDLEGSGDSEEPYETWDDLFDNLRSSVWLNCHDVSLESLQALVMMVCSLHSIDVFTFHR